MLRRGCAFLGLGLVLLLVGVLTVALAGNLPWWAVLFAGLFWTMVALKVRARRAGGDVAGEDGPRWNPLGSGGGF